MYTLYLVFQILVLIFPIPVDGVEELYRHTFREGAHTAQMRGSLIVAPKPPDPLPL